MVGLLDRIKNAVGIGGDESSNISKSVEEMLEYQAEQISAGNIPQGEAFQDAQVEIEEINFDENRVELTAEEMRAIMGTPEEAVAVSTEEVANTEPEPRSEPEQGASTDGVDLNERVEISPEDMPEIPNVEQEGKTDLPEDVIKEEVTQHGSIDDGIEVEDISMEEYEKAVQAAKDAAEMQSQAQEVANTEPEQNVSTEGIDLNARVELTPEDMAGLTSAEPEQAASADGIDLNERVELTPEDIERMVQIEAMEKHRDGLVESGELDDKADFLAQGDAGIEVDVMDMPEIDGLDMAVEDVRSAVSEATQAMDEQVEAVNDHDIGEPQGHGQSSGASR